VDGNLQILIITYLRFNLTQIKAVKGLGRYAKERTEVQGIEEIDRILEVSDETSVWGRQGEYLRMRLMVSAVGLGIL
jgi:hypothetical protein